MSAKTYTLDRRAAKAAGARDAQQGHLYAYDLGGRVIAMTSGPLPMVARMDVGPWLGQPFQTPSWSLTPLPMKYFHGEIPR